jgi:hypothetical protein
MITFEGITQPIEEWALDYGIPAKLIKDRLKRGWTVERAITQPMRLVKLSKRKPASQDRRARLYTHNGETLMVRQWAERAGVSPDTFRQRLVAGWTFAEAIGEAPRSIRYKPSGRILEHNGERLNVSQWARRLGIERVTITARLREGWPIERALTEPTRPRRSPTRPGARSRLSQEQQGPARGGTRETEPKQGFFT